MGEHAREATIPPGPDLPRARQSRRWIGRPLSFLRELQGELGDLFTIHLQYQDPWVVVGDPELVKRVFTAPADVLRSGEANAHFAPILGLNSLLTLDGETHMRHRKLLLPPFHGERIARYGEIMRAATERELERWPKGEPAAAAPRMSALTLEVILRAVFGARERERMEPLREAMSELTAAAGSARLALLGRAERLREERFAGFRRVLAQAHERVLAEIAHHRADPRLEERDDVMSLLLRARFEDGSAMGDEELRDELMTLLLAGHETTAMSLAWALERLVRHPEALRRATAEADEGGGPYTEAVVRETLRARPVFAVVARLVKEPFELGGHEIPPGVTIMPSPVLVHHRPDLYPEPDEFRPERFLERKPGTYSWIPFGGGVRRCIGASFAQLEMKVVLATLLERLRPSVRDQRPEPPARRLITIGPAHGASLVVEERLRVRDFGGGLRIACRRGTTDERAIAPWAEWLQTPAPRPSEPGPGDTILDVGAHIGCFAVLAASLVPDGRVLAVEADRENYEMLLRNVKLNGLKNVEADHLALAGQTGQVRLHRSATGNWGHSITRAAPEGNGETVSSTTLESYLRDRGVERCDMAKLNCEGAEFQILLGASPDALRTVRRMLVLYHADLVDEPGIVGKLEDHLEEAGFELERQETSPCRGRLLAALVA